MDKNERKVRRKKQRILKNLSMLNALPFCDHPSKVLLVGNAGLTTGASRESIFAHFMPYVAPHRVIMVPGRQFCIVQFSTADEAAQAMKEVDGAPGDPVLYLSFLERVPGELCHQTLCTELPPGATLLTDFLTAAEEENILSQLHWGNDGTMKHRQVQHFGYEFDYSTNNVDPARPLPEGLPAWCDGLVSRLLDLQVIDEPPDQLTCNHYLPGQGIPPHVDTHSAFRGALVSVTLGGASTMEFSRPPPEPLTASVRLPRRSALVMDAEARYLWSHGITPRKFDITSTPAGDLTLTARATRVSLTFRRLRRAPCACRYPTQCDSRAADGEPPRRDTDATLAHQLERTYVADVYENIASHFSDTRHKPWPRVRAFVEALPAGSLMLDVGCGNGKYLGLRPGVYELGVDQSVRLCEIARARAHQTLAAGCLPLAVRDGAVDACICIAVIHHLASRDRRVAALAEICRVLRPAGTALVYVWALEQRLGARAAGYLKPNRSAEPSDGHAGLPLPVHTNRTEFKQQDMLVPWKLQQRGGGAKESPNVQDSPSVHHRFYHVYRQGELEEDVRSVSALSVRDSWYDQGNWCCLMQKDS